MNKTLNELNELIKEAYDIAQKRNHCFTFDEAKIYDPVISVLFQALKLSDELLHDEKKTIEEKIIKSWIHPGDTILNLLEDKFKINSYLTLNFFNNLNGWSVLKIE